MCPDGQGGRLHNREGVHCAPRLVRPRYVHKGWRYGLRNLVHGGKWGIMFSLRLKDFCLAWEALAVCTSWLAGWLASRGAPPDPGGTEEGRGRRERRGMGGHDLTHSVKSFSLSHFRSRFDRILLPGQVGFENFSLLFEFVLLV